LTVTGSTKFDVVIPDRVLGEAKARRAALAGSRPVWIAASTGTSEEEIVLDAFQLVRAAVPDSLLVLAPRHPSRANEIARLCGRKGVSVRRHTAARIEAAPVADEAVYLLDTMGELMEFYALADVAFVGGSLNGSGGHNVLEPAALSVPVLVGPDTHNFAEITHALIEAQGAYRVRDATDLGETITALLLDRKRCHHAGTAARAFFESRGGATERVTVALLRILARKPARAR
jgi:3-deoxy-D-manno-octulosonic-acid transferase